MHFQRFIGLLLVGVATGLAQKAPPPQRAYVDSAMRNDGDASRGKELFQSAKLACTQCHSVDGSSSKAGPDLAFAGDKFPGVTQENRNLKAVRQIATSPQFIASFGTDEAGNIYVVGYEGMIYKMALDEADFDSPLVNGSSTSSRQDK